MEERGNKDCRKLHKGEILFRQGESGPLYQLHSGALKIVRLHEDGHATLMNMIVPGELIPHHSLLSPKPYHGTAIAMAQCEVETIAPDEWYASLEADPSKLRAVALQLQEKLRMMQQRIDQLAETSPAEKLRKLDLWFRTHIGPIPVTEALTQDEIGQFIGLRRETVNRLLRAT